MAIKQLLVKRSNRTVDEGEMGFHDYTTYKEKLEQFMKRVSDAANNLNATIITINYINEDNAIIVYDKDSNENYSNNKVINSFREDYYFLSNFFNAPVTWGGITYQNNEAAFQSAKVQNVTERAPFANMDPSTAKKKGRHVSLRSDWEDVKYNIMYEICLAKFSQNKDLKDKLLSTGDSYLEEGNTWGDTVWGTVNGHGDNNLGKILMRVRSELRGD